LNIEYFFDKKFIEIKPRAMEEFGHALDIVGKPFMSMKY
jgi:hypothetical protein